MDTVRQENDSRDATSLRMLGSFFCLLGLILLGGLWWSLDDMAATVVTLASSLVLLIVGVGMLLGARRLKRLATQSRD